MIYVVMDTKYERESKILYAGTNAKDALLSAHRYRAPVFIHVWNKGQAHKELAKLIAESER